MEHTLARRSAGTPRTWSLCMTSENHGTVGPAGCTFSHAPEKHERVLVVEVPTPAGAPSDQVNLKLITAPVAAQAGKVVAALPAGQPMIGKLLDQFSALPVLWGLNEPGALVRHSDVFKMLVAAGKAAQVQASSYRQEGGAA